MKIVTKFILLLTVLFVTSCKKNEVLDESNILTKITEIQIPINKGSTNYSKPGSTLSGSIEFRMDEENEEFLGYTFSKEILNATNLTNQELVALVESSISINPEGFLKKNSKSLSKPQEPFIAYGLSSCKAECHKMYTNENGEKQKGRGWCKFVCYTDVVVEVAVKVIIALL